MTVKVVVKDSVKPAFVDLQKEYKVQVNDKLKKELFIVNDVSKVEVTLDDSKVDYTKEGTYKATLKVIDGSKNETIQEITVVVSAEAKSVAEQVKDVEAKVQTSQSTNSKTTVISKPKPSTNNNTSTSKPSTGGNTVSKPSGGSTSGTSTSKPSKPTTCKHQWLEEYDIVYHDPVYGTEKKWIVDEPAHEQPIYETITKTWCYGCNAYFDFQTESDIANHLTWHEDRGDRVYNYRFDDFQEIVGYESVPEKGHYEEVEVVIKEGYQETVLVRTYCGDCGAEK